MKLFDNWWTQQDSHIYGFLKPVTVQYADEGINTIAVDDVRGYIYWNEGKPIYRATLNGSKSEQIITNSKLYMCIYIIK